MIAIIDNDEAYSSHEIYFVEVPRGVDEAALKRLFPPKPDDAPFTVVPYIVGLAERIDWWEGKCASLSDVLSPFAFIDCEQHCYFQGAKLVAPVRWTTPLAPAAEPWEVELGPLHWWICPNGPRGADDLIRSIGEGWGRTRDDEHYRYFLEALAEGAFR